MALKIYIFIFFSLSFVLIESAGGMENRNSGLRFVSDSIPVRFPGGWMPGSPAGLPYTFAVRELTSSGAKLAVINEIMADPTPVAGLPDREYIELFNPGLASISLKGWMLGLGSKQKLLPEVTLVAGGYLLLTSTGGGKELLTYGPVLEISGLSINNAGAVISLYNPEMRLVDQIAYEPALHSKGFADGGYSLERIDPGRFCGQRYNWATTREVRGGTPGRENTVRAQNPDLISPQIVSSSLVDHKKLTILFSEFTLFPANPAAAIVNLSSGLVVDSVSLTGNSDGIVVSFDAGNLQSGRDYSLGLHGLKDECGNEMGDQVVKFGYYLPVSQDLLLSEVLFDPFPGGAEFVEIYNNCLYDADLSELFLATGDETGKLKQVVQLSSNHQVLAPGTYLAVTRSREGVLQFYHAACDQCILQNDRLPALTNESGCLMLLNLNGVILDAICYTKAMHHPFVTEAGGISLERIRFSVPASFRDNWLSATESAGFATPGYRNSNADITGSAKDIVSIAPAIFSPNGDGFNDALEIFVNTGEPGWIININLLNSLGVVVRSLANNLTVGSSDHLCWDGLGDNHEPLEPGIYILNINLFKLSGSQRRVKLACVITDLPGVP